MTVSYQYFKLGTLGVRVEILGGQESKKSSPKFRTKSRTKFRTKIDPARDGSGEAPTRLCALIFVCVHVAQAENVETAFFTLAKDIRSRAPPDAVRALEIPCNIRREKG